MNRSTVYECIWYFVEIRFDSVFLPFTFTSLSTDTLIP